MNTNTEQKSPAELLAELQATMDRLKSEQAAVITQARQQAIDQINTIMAENEITLPMLRKMLKTH